MDYARASTNQNMTTLLFKFKKMRATVVVNLRPLRIRTLNHEFLTRFKDQEMLYDHKQSVLLTQDPLIGYEWGVLDHENEEHSSPKIKIKF